MLFPVVVATIVMVSQAASISAKEDLFSLYHRPASKFEGASIRAHAAFAFQGPSSERALPNVVDTLDDDEVYSNGFTYVNFYDQTACGGNIVAVAGRPTNVCLLAYENTTSSEPTGSYIYSCNSGTAYTQQFTDLECTNSLPLLQERLICENQVGRYASMRGFCNEEPGVLPLPNADFVSEIQYDSPTTCDATIEQFESFATDHCFKISTSSSIKYNNTAAFEYTDDSCSGTAAVEVLPQTCVPVTTYPVDAFDNVASQWTSGEVTTGLYNSPGYVWVDLYQSKGCAGQVVAQEGHPTGVCLLLYGNATSSDPTGSYMYMCNSESELYTEYSDLACAVETTTSSSPMTCKNLLGRFGSGQPRCNSDQTQLPLELGQFVVETLYNTADACDTISTFNTFKDDTCFHNGNVGFAYQWPNVTVYDGDSTCSGEPTTNSALPQDCQLVTVFPADTKVASQWSYSDIPYVPTAAPTIPPTAAPTPAAYSAGYVYVNFYEERGCSGPVVAVTGHPTETCLMRYEDGSSSAATGSIKYTCYGDQSMTAEYTDTNCQVPLGNTTNTLGCRNALGRFGSAQGMCNSDNSRLPLPAHNFTTELLFDSPTTCDATVAEFESYENKHCFDNSGNSAFKYIFPQIFYYNAGTCAGSPASNNTLSQECVTITEYPINGLNLAYKWVYGDVTFGSSSSSDTLSTAEIAGIAVGGAVALVGIAAGAYYFMGQGAASAAMSSGSSAAATNPMVTPV
mmetsp:Transcript_125656/g.246258  ORF Transcript_125656/g.246258 Transcript_125656/m.246258 type:complete len:739 (+) Transcript_125656:70-2286(+)|eukprot:CAMPEP_0170377280 /NCGR_PEP_ID=MMETSP0117_2-20130122/12188_1 /TAXON_ID=400756 /ORGANISM="Durinskia baltica, Strain CSIRO CS-38" /LENGTH=738 /DNA_ID=CAMNT_0010632567 /DNA_START=65 /DNA_END=2281 /DNA_ORIENTATION=-